MLSFSKDVEELHVSELFLDMRTKTSYSSSNKNINVTFIFRYVTRRPARSKLLAERARQLTIQRSGGGDCTTDDDAAFGSLPPHRLSSQNRFLPPSKSERKPVAAQSGGSAKNRAKMGDNNNKKGGKLEKSGKMTTSLDGDNVLIEDVNGENDIWKANDAYGEKDNLSSPSKEGTEVLVTVMTV